MSGAEKVVVSLKGGYADAALRADNHFELEQLPAKVRKAGFTAGEAEITAKGVFTSLQKRPAFKVGGRNDLVFLLQPVRQDGSMLYPPADTPVEVTGTIRSFQHSKNEPLTLWVSRIEPAKPAGTHAASATRTKG